MSYKPIYSLNAICRIFCPPLTDDSKKILINGVEDSDGLGLQTNKNDGQIIN